VRLIITILCITALYSCQPSGEAGSEDSGKAQIEAGVTRWDEVNFPIELKISKKFTNDEVEGIELTSSEWETATENQLNFFTIDSDPSNTNIEYSDLNDYNDDEMGIYSMDSWNDSLPTDALAVTQLFGLQNSNGSVEITHADILLNEESYNFTTDPEDSTKYDLNTVMLHEIGHFIGLAHVGFNVESIMNPSISSGDVMRETALNDKQTLAATYSLTTSHYDGSALSAEDESFKLVQGLSGDNQKKFVKILIQLKADGECVHTMNGETIHSHQSEI